MEILFTILAKTTTQAVIEIIVMILVAGIIGYFTSYFYHRAVYSKRIEKLEAEKEGLERKVDGLQAANDELNKKISELEKEK